MYSKANFNSRTHHNHVEFPLSMFTCLAMLFYAKVNKRPRISLQQMKKRSSVNRQHDIKICKSCEIVQFWQNQSFLGVVSHFNTKRCGWANCPNPFFFFFSDAELLTQYPSFAVEIKRINNIGNFFHLPSIFEVFCPFPWLSKLHRPRWPRSK